jgi:hypothetical protein
MYSWCTLALALTPSSSQETLDGGDTDPNGKCPRKCSICHGEHVESVFRGKRILPHVLKVTGLEIEGR